jgi:hypothetical protein
MHTPIIKTAMLTDCLLNSILGPEDGGNMLICKLLPNYTASHTRSQYSSELFSCTDYLFYNWITFRQIIISFTNSKELSNTQVATSCVTIR